MDRYTRIVLALMKGIGGQLQHADPVALFKQVETLADVFEAGLGDAWNFDPVVAAAPPHRPCWAEFSNDEGGCFFTRIALVVVRASGVVAYLEEPTHAIRDETDRAATSFMEEPICVSLHSSFRRLHWGCLPDTEDTVEYELSGPESPSNIQ